MFQLRDYNAKRYLRFFNNKKWLLWLACFIIFITQIYVFCLTRYDYLFTFISNFVLLVCGTFLHYKLIKSSKTPLNFTWRFKRLYTLSAVMFLPCLFCPLGVGLMFVLLPIVAIIANFINVYDKLKNKYYICKARKKLKQINPKIIAITGSNGKTSVKNILAELLNGHGAVVTPKSYNTPIGIASFVNNQLPNKCKYLILEYGARRKGEIKKLCKLFGADYGICSLVAPQHLETFKNIENIYKTKKELSDFLGNNFCTFNFNNPYTKKMFFNKNGKKAGVFIENSNNYIEFYKNFVENENLNTLNINEALYKNLDIIKAKNIKISNFKTEFELDVYNKIFKCETSLLGTHNVTNILLAISVAIELNISVEEILQHIKNLKFTPHRLEYIKGYINILDDSYNCSIASAKESLFVLSCTNYKKMVCTPGIIEGGEKQFEINFNLGKLCSFCDYVIIVGLINKVAIFNGLKSKNFDEKNIICVSGLEEAKKHFSLLNTNDCLLLLNDLPDDYV